LSGAKNRSKVCEGKRASGGKLKLSENVWLLKKAGWKTDCGCLNQGMATLKTKMEPIGLPLLPLLPVLWR
jgi:hypothetical protein